VGLGASEHREDEGVDDEGADETADYDDGEGALRV
jgi:hypothetical protein